LYAFFRCSSIKKGKEASFVVFRMVEITKVLFESYDSSSQQFRIVVQSQLAEYILYRSYHDLQVVNRLSKDRSKDGIPVAAFQKLATACSWIVDGSGWDRKLQRSLSTVQRWLCKALSCITVPEFGEVVDEVRYKEEKIQKLERKKLEARPKQLQQYFASDVNIAEVMAQTLHGISQVSTDSGMRGVQHQNSFKKARLEKSHHHGTDRSNTELGAARISCALSSSSLAPGSPPMLSRTCIPSNTAADTYKCTCTCTCRENIGSMRDVLFVEPSCGDGRILRRLLELGAVHAAAVDVDPVVAAVAQAAFDGFALPVSAGDCCCGTGAGVSAAVSDGASDSVSVSAGVSGTQIDCSCPCAGTDACGCASAIPGTSVQSAVGSGRPAVSVIVQDFLTTTREQLLHSCATLHRNSDRDRAAAAAAAAASAPTATSTPSVTATVTVTASSSTKGVMDMAQARVELETDAVIEGEKEDKSHKEEEEVKIVVVGGPPFTIVPAALPSSATGTGTSLSSAGTAGAVSAASAVVRTPVEALKPSSEGSLEEGFKEAAPGKAAAEGRGGGGGAYSGRAERRESVIDYTEFDKSDFPLLFLQHSARVLRAVRIVFILPERCAHVGFIRQAAAAMNSPIGDMKHAAASSISGATNGAGVGYSSGRGSGGSDSRVFGDVPSSGVAVVVEPGNLGQTPAASASASASSPLWRHTASIPADSSFFILGREIKQPAVVQVWDYCSCCTVDDVLL
jgi:hypothetical protein